MGPCDRNVSRHGNGATAGVRIDDDGSMKTWWVLVLTCILDPQGENRLFSPEYISPRMKLVHYPPLRRLIP